MNYKFDVDFLEDAKTFLDNLDEKSRDKTSKTDTVVIATHGIIPKFTTVNKDFDIYVIKYKF